MAEARGGYVASTLVARAFLRLANREGVAMPPLKLMKLVYLAHAWFMAHFDGRPLVSDRVEAWDNGPVFPDLFKSIEKYGKRHVERVQKSRREALLGFSTTLDDDETELIEAVYHHYKHLKGSQLSWLTHQEGSPWDRTWDDCEPYQIIDSDVIWEHYVELKDKAQKEARDGQQV